MVKMFAAEAGEIERDLLLPNIIRQQYLQDDTH